MDFGILHPLLSAPVRRQACRLPFLKGGVTSVDRGSSWGEVEYKESWVEVGPLLGPVPGNTWLSQYRFVAFQSPKNEPAFFIGSYLTSCFKRFSPLLHVVSHTFEIFKFLFIWFYYKFF